jgi:aspartate kinase
MIVLKFGGTSVENAEAIRNVVDIVSKELHRSPLIVVSACAGTTNELIAAVQNAVDGSVARSLKRIEGLRVRHIEIADELLTDDHCHSFQRIIDKDIAELVHLISSIGMLREASGRTIDYILSFGERWSSRLLTLALVDGRFRVRLVPATSVLITNDEYGRAFPLIKETTDRARTLLLPHLQRNNIVVTQGFVGSTMDGSVTTIGRGGSDYSASLFSAVLDAEETQIWTDVDGILSADPAIVSGTILLNDIPFDLVTELAHYGAKVIHPRTVLPTMKKRIPVRILNSRNPQASGTSVSYTFPATEQLRERRLSSVDSIACKNSIALVSVRNVQGFPPSEFFRDVVESFTRSGCRIESIVNSETGVLAVLDAMPAESAIVRSLEPMGEVIYRNHKSIISIVGSNLRSNESLRWNIQSALADAGIRIHSSFDGVTNHCLAYVVEETAADEVVRLLHHRFIELRDNTALN